MKNNYLKVHKRQTQTMRVHVMPVFLQSLFLPSVPICYIYPQLTYLKPENMRKQREETQRERERGRPRVNEKGSEGDRHGEGRVEDILFQTKRVGSDPPPPVHLAPTSLSPSLNNTDSAHSCTSGSKNNPAVTMATCATPEPPQSARDR